MSNQSEQQRVERQSTIRDMLFGDAPSSAWPGEAATATQSEPWLSFVRAREQSNAGDQEGATRTLRQILAQPDLESRHYLQAWNFLRRAGVEPSADEAKRLYGVVVEVAFDDGLDIVAAYADHTARYLNYSGAAVIWERPNASLDPLIDSLLETGRAVVEQIGPWEGSRPPAPQSGQARINMLVPSGLHFGQAPFEVLASDALGGPVIRSAMQLMQALIAQTEQGKV